MSYQDHVRRRFWDRDNWVELDTKLNLRLVIYSHIGKVVAALHVSIVLRAESFPIDFLSVIYPT